MADREAFEAHMSDNGKWTHAIQRKPSGEYVLMSASEGWRFWQAACKYKDDQHESQELSKELAAARYSLGHYE